MSADVKNELREQVEGTFAELSILRRRILERARDHRVSNEDALVLSASFSAVCSAMAALEELRKAAR